MSKKGSVKRVVKEAKNNSKIFDEVPLQKTKETLRAMPKKAPFPAPKTVPLVSTPKPQVVQPVYSQRYHHLMDSLIVVGMAGGFTSLGFAFGMWLR